VPTSTRTLAGVAAAVAAAGLVLGCASGSSGSQENNAAFAKSVREADPNKKGTQPKSDKPKSAPPAPSDFKLPGKHVYLEYADNDKKLGLVNRGTADPDSVNSQQIRKQDVFVKVASDDLMADICEALRRLDFGKFAESDPPLDGALWSLTMVVDGQHRTVFYVRGRDAERQRRLSNIQATFLLGFNRVYGLRAVDPNEGGRALFDQEKVKLKAQNQESMKKATEKP
jgi:hypothetical protein